jgi:hypothetical protein
MTGIVQADSRSLILISTWTYLIRERRIPALASAAYDAS